MPLRQIELPAFGRSLSVLMGAPSSSKPDSHFAGLDAFYQQGGNALHLHGEGGEIHSRQAVGEWLRTNRLRQAFFLCTQLCHDDWDDTTQQSVNRFTPEAVHQDVATDLQLIGTDFLDMVYLDDRPLWPEYVPFDTAFMQTVTELDLVVLAHVGDFTLGQCLFGDEDPLSRMHPEWVERWQHPDNVTLASRIQEIAAAQGSTTRTVQMAWLLNQSFPVIAIVSLPSFQTEMGQQYALGSRMPLADTEQIELSMRRFPIRSTKRML